MLGNQNILVAYDAHAEASSSVHVCLQICNSFGMVTDVTACYNRRGEAPGGEKSCSLQYVRDKSNEKYSVFEGNVSFENPGYRTFYIRLYLNGQNKFIEYDENKDEAVLTDRHDRAFWQLYVYYPYFKTPDWVKGGIMYQIFVDTFCSKNLPENLKGKVVTWNTFPKWEPDSDGTYRNNQFYGGNLKGIISKLDYLKTLNVSVIYLTPIFKSQSSNRYDIDDYEAIDPLAGTWDDLDELHKKANALGMKLIVDMVFNHSGNGNRLIQQEPDMYDWIKKYTEPKCWWGYKNLVEFNKNSEKFYQYLLKWLKLYSNFMDGIRLDVADNLPDRVLTFIREHSGFYILGEVWKNAVLGDGRDFLIGDKLDGVMNYQTPNGIYRCLRWGNYRNFKKTMKELELYPPQALDVSPIFLSSHDTPRIANILVGDFMKEDPNFETVWDMERDDYWFENGKFNTYKFRSWEFQNDRVPADEEALARNLKKLAVFMQYTLPGLPSVLAGEEAGVQGYKDPFNRKPFPWNNMDEEWYQYYKSLGEFRKKYSKLFSDSRNFKVLRADETLLVYGRGTMIFYVNRTESEVKIEFSLERTEFRVQEIQKSFTLPPYGAVAI